MDYTLILQLISYAVGIIGGAYGIIMRRKLVRFQLKTEQAKASYYNSKRKAEEMRKNEHLVRTGKTFWDWITGSKPNSSESV